MLKKLLNKKFIITILIIAIVGGYFGYKSFFKKDNQVHYILANVQKGTIVVSVSGSGQISAKETIDVKPKISGEVKEIYLAKGSEVKKGQLILALDDKDYQKAVRDAQKALETAQLELDKLLKPADDLTLKQTENALTQAKETKQTAEDNLKKAYEDGFNAVSNVFLGLPDIMDDFDDVLFSFEYNVLEPNIDYYANAVKMYDEKILQYRNDSYNKYQIAKQNYDKNLADYKKTSRFSEKETIEALINETAETTKNIAEAIKSANDLINFYQNILKDRNLKPQALSNTHISTLNSYTTSVNSYLSNLLSTKNSIDNYKDTILSSQRTIEEKELSLKKLKEGPDELDIRAKKINIEQKEDALNNAKENLADCYLVSPLNGLVADIKVKRGETVNLGTILANIIAKEKIAEISLNELDAAKVKLGQKATLTFDALPDLTLTGKVVEMDEVGTVSQGVVSYGLKIALDSDDDRVKPGMSVSADIIVEAKPDVLVLANSAIKTQNNSHYVQLIEAAEKTKNNLKIGSSTNLPKEAKIKNQTVEIGISNDSLTEIISGLKEGDIAISSTITSATQNNQTQRTQQFQFPGMTPQRR